MNEHEALALIQQLNEEYADALKTDSSDRPERDFAWQVRAILKETVFAESVETLQYPTAQEEYEQATEDQLSDENWYAANWRRRDIERLAEAIRERKTA